MLWSVVSYFFRILFSWKFWSHKPRIPSVQCTQKKKTLAFLQIAIQEDNVQVLKVRVDMCLHSCLHNEVLLWYDSGDNKNGHSIFFYCLMLWCRQSQRSQLFVETVLFVRVFPFYGRLRAKFLISNGWWPGILLWRVFPIHTITSGDCVEVEDLRYPTNERAPAWGFEKGRKSHNCFVQIPPWRLLSLPPSSLPLLPSLLPKRHALLLPSKNLRCVDSSVTAKQFW